MGTIVANVVIANDDSDENNFLFRIQGEGINIPVEPEMDVFGSGLEITSGDTTPSATDDTNFGQTDVTSGNCKQYIYDTK